MAYNKIWTILANAANFGGKRSTSKIKYIVIHFTTNDGDKDENNGKYFKNNVVKASAHYFVDSNSITVSVKENYVAWAVGGSKYSDCSSTGGGKYYKKCTNSNSISIELCDDNKNGKIYPSQATIDNAIQLTKELMKKYDIPKENVIRHFDVTGKKCPGYWCGSASKDKKWKTEFWNKLDEVDNKINTVVEVQAWLNKNYKANIAEDNDYGMKTQKALIKALQTELNNEYGCKLTVDGIWSSKVKKAIKTLKPGTRNNIVKVLQAFLICHDAPVLVGGYYGDATAKYVQKLKEEMKFKTINQNAGSAFFEKLCK